METYTSLVAHEVEHAKHLRDVGPDAVKEYVDAFNSDDQYCSKALFYIEDRKARWEKKGFYRSDISNAISAAVNAKYLPGEGFHESDAGEDEATTAGRIALEVEFLLRNVVRNE